MRFVSLLLIRWADRIVVARCWAECSPPVFSDSCIASAACEDATRAVDIVRAIRQLSAETRPWQEGLFVHAWIVETDLVATDHQERIKRYEEVALSGCL